MMQIHHLRHPESASLDSAIALVDEALRMCDALGHAHAAIDLSAAAAKLCAIRERAAIATPHAE